MCTLNDDNEYSVEIDADVYNQDYDEANPGEQEIEKEETNIMFE